MKTSPRPLSSLLPATLALLLAIAAADRAVAQSLDFDQIAPKLPQKNGSGEIINKVDNHSATVSTAGDTVVLKNLKGVVLVADPLKVKLDGITSPRPIDTGAVTFADRPDLAAILQPYIGKPVTLKTLGRLTRSMVAYYRAHGRPVVNVFVPLQAVETGYVQIVVLESRVDHVEGTGAVYFNNNELASEVSLRPGDPIRSSEIRDDLDWINRNPFVQSDILLSPGDAPGTSLVTLKTKDRFPLRPYVSYEDNGNAQTGFDRYEAGFNYGDLFGVGQQLNYQYTTSGDGQSLRAHAGSYIIPLPWRNELTFFGSYSDTKGEVPPLLGIEGRTYQISGRYTVPLPTFAYRDLTYKHSIAAGFDYKYNKNALQFGAVPAGGSLYDIDQFALTYNGTLNDAYGQTTLEEDLYISPGNWGGNNNDTAFDNAHTFASSDYVYSYLSLQRTTRLPGNFSLILRGSVQRSNGNLAPSEQIGLGGFDSVRGYDEREVNADEGHTFTTEVRTPSIGIGELVGHPEFKDQLQFLGFWDYGAAYNHTLLAGEPNEIPLSSVGVGVRYSISSYLSVRYDYGFQLLSTGFDNDHGSRSDLGIVLSY